MDVASQPPCPSDGIGPEARAFYAALAQTPPAALTACAGWTAHELVAHLTAVGIEVALNLEAYVAGRQVPATRGFEEREAPWRRMDDAALREALPQAMERMSAALDEVLAAEPDAVVPWTGRQMAVPTFVTHLRSEFAIHRWDLVGDDSAGTALLAQPELTDHAVSVLGRVLPARGAASAAPGFTAAMMSPETSDVVAVADAEGARLVRAAPAADPVLSGDPAARLLFLWGRRPGDPRRLAAPRGAERLAELAALLAGY